MPRAIVYESSKNLPKTRRIMTAVAEGLKHHRYTIEMRDSCKYPEGGEQDADLLAIWGDYLGTERIFNDRFDFKKLLHIDNGYIGRGHYQGYYSVTYGRKQAVSDLWRHPRPSTIAGNN